MKRTTGHIVTALVIAVVGLMARAPVAEAQGEPTRSEAAETAWVAELDGSALEAALVEQGWTLAGRPLLIVEPGRQETIVKADRRGVEATLRLMRLEDEAAAVELADVLGQAEDAAVERSGASLLVVVVEGQPAQVGRLLAALRPRTGLHPMVEEDPSGSAQAGTLSPERLRAKLEAGGWAIVASPKTAFKADHSEDIVQAESGVEEVTVRLLHFRSEAMAAEHARAVALVGGVASWRDRAVVLTVAGNGGGAHSQRVLDELLAGEGGTEATLATVSAGSARPGAAGSGRSSPSGESLWQPWGAGDMVAQLASGAVGALAGAIGGALAGFVVLGLLTDDIHGAALGVGLGGTVGVPLGVAGGVTLVGDASGGDGSYWATLLGTVGGGLVGGLLGVLYDDSVLVLTVPVGAMLGTIVGYNLSASPVPAPSTAARRP